MSVLTVRNEKARKTKGDCYRINLRGSPAPYSGLFIILALRRLRQRVAAESEASLGYRAPISDFHSNVPLRAGDLSLVSKIYTVKGENKLPKASSELLMCRMTLVLSNA